jgi:hypothetical protein
MIFLVVERRSPAPLMRLGIFRLRSRATADLTLLLVVASRTTMNWARHTMTTTTHGLLARVPGSAVTADAWVIAAPEPPRVARRENPDRRAVPDPMRTRSSKGAPGSVIAETVKRGARHSDLDHARILKPGRAAV